MRDMVLVRRGLFHSLSEQTERYIIMYTHAMIKQRFCF